MIPKIFHRIWLGPNEPPTQMAEHGETWMAHHPDWVMRTWGDEDFHWIRNRRLFDRATSYTQKVDIAKYELIDRHGGVHLDVDIECLRPITDLLVGKNFFAGWEPDGGVGVAIFAAEARH